MMAPLQPSVVPTLLSPIPTSAPVAVNYPTLTPYPSAPVPAGTIAPEPTPEPTVTPRATATPRPTSSPDLPTSSQAAAETPAPVPGPTARLPYVKGTSIEWTAQNVPVTNGPYPPYPAGYDGGSLNGVAGDEGGIVAVGTDDSVTSGFSLGSAASWLPGGARVTWSEHLVSGADPGFDALAAYGGVFVASSFDNEFWYSSDGVNWTRAASGPASIDIALNPGLGGSADLVPGLGGFVSMVRAGSWTEAWTSDDGSHWNRAPAQSALQGFCPMSLAASPSRAVAVGSGCPLGASAGILVSSDGLHWSHLPLPAGIDFQRPYRASVSFAGGRFVLMATYRDATHDGTAVWSSADGTRWSRTSFLAARGDGPDYLGSVVPFGAGWVAAGSAPVSEGCTPIVWTTPDLVHWTRAALPSPPWHGSCGQPEAIAVSQGRVIVVGSAWDVATISPVAWTGTLSFQARVSADVTRPAAMSNAVQAHWLP